MNPLDIELITDNTGSTIGALIDDIPYFENLLLDDEKELVYWKVYDGDNEKILISSFDCWNTHIKEMYIESMKELEI